MNLDELNSNLNNIRTQTQYSAKEVGIGIIEFGKILDEFNKLSDYEKAQFWIEAFKDPTNKEGCKEFALRHPDCSFNTFIPKD